MALVRFSIITASYRQLPWLKRCTRSVADQQGVEVEHLIQDGGSGAELETWIRTESKADLAVAPDTGMYDALNRAIDRVSGEIVGILNCDEQYLPGTLQKVAEMFAENPWADIVAGDYLVVNVDQELLAFRKVTPLRRSMILTDHLYAFTCAMFFRRSIFSGGLRFDTSLRSVADGEFVARALERGHRTALLHDYLSTFTWTGENLSAQQISREEDERIRSSLPAWMRIGAPALKRWRQIERYLAGGYRSGPITYEVYCGEDDLVRSRITCERPSFRYPGA